VGTVTNVSVVTANGFSGSVANSSTTPAITLFAGALTPTSVAPSGLTGSTAASRYVGATASGAPVSGAHLLGDWVIDQTGSIYICTTAGTPGTWTQVAGGGSAAWGSITGTLSSQTDLQTALNAKVPTTRTVAGYPLSSDVTLTMPDVTNGKFSLAMSALTAYRS